MKLGSYLGLLQKAEQTLAESYHQVAEGHGHEPDVHFLCLTLAQQCDRHKQALQQVVDRYGSGDDSGDDESEPERLHADGLSDTRSGPVGLLRDLQDLYILANFVDCTWTMIKQAGQALRDQELLGIVSACDTETATRIAALTVTDAIASLAGIVGAHNRPIA